MLYQYLKENYIPGEPIFTGDIDIRGMTEENLRYHLKKLTDNGIICRFEPGVYYFPKIDIFGEPMSLSADTVAVHKYIIRRGKLKEAGVPYEVSDERQKGKSICVDFSAELYPEQRKASEQMQRYENGILHAATAFGKTAVGAYLIAARKTFLMMPGTK